MENPIPAFTFITPYTPIAITNPTTRRLTKCHPRTVAPSHRRPRKSGLPQPQTPSTMSTSTTTEETFAIDAGRDLFFAAMTPEDAIALLDLPASELPSRDDRFIAAERLKFFPRPDTAAALLRFVARVPSDAQLEERVARRKAAESLGRHAGACLRDEVVDALVHLLRDDDYYMVDVAVWALAQVAPGEHRVMSAVASVLDDSRVAKRVVIRSLLAGRHVPALPRIEALVDDPAEETASAAMSAVAVLSGRLDAMAPVPTFLKSSDLNLRRAAMEDITLARYTPALPDVAVAPNSLVLRARTARILLDARDCRSLEEDPDTMRLLDRLLWDHPNDLDLLGMKKQTRKARDPERNIRQLYRNDAAFAYLACKTLAEDHRDSSEIGDLVLRSYNDLGYFDYFGAYHVYKTLGWLRCSAATDLLLDNAENLPPRFFNHKAGAITALAALDCRDALPVFAKVARNTTIWELKYACLLASQRLGDTTLRDELRDDEDWIIRERARSTLGFDHLRDSFLSSTSV